MKTSSVKSTVEYVLAVLFELCFNQMASINLLMENTVDVQSFRMDCHFNSSITGIHIHLEWLDLLQGNDLKAQLMSARCGSRTFYQHHYVRRIQLSRWYASVSMIVFMVVFIHFDGHCLETCNQRYTVQPKTSPLFEMQNCKNFPQLNNVAVFRYAYEHAW